MKHSYLLLLLCSFAISFSHAQIVNIPDPVFKDLLLNGDAVAYEPGYDANGDGELQVSEAETITGIYVEELGSGGIIYDLTGIEALVNLESFALYDIFQGSTIDLSQNTALKYYLYLASSNLTEVDLSQNTQLEILGIHNSQISTLDLSAHVNLHTIDVSNNQLTNIVFPEGVFLNELMLQNNQLTSLDLSPINKIGDYGFNCSNNPLTEFITGDATFVGDFRCENTLLTSLNVKPEEFLAIYVNNNYNLQYIQSKNPVPGETSYNLVERIYADNCPNLEVICVEYPDAIYSDGGHYAYSPSSVIPAQTIISTDCSTTSDDLNQIFGTITFDDENDGCDASDPTMDGVLVQTTDGTNTFSTNTYSNGFYAESVNEGTFTVSLQNLPSYFNVTPATQSTTFTGLNNTETLNFCVTSTQTINDVNVTLIPTSQARPGFNASYQLIYKNVGTTTLSGDVTLHFDDAMQTFVSANPIADASTVNSLTFNYSNLEPFESRTIDIVLNTFTPGTVDGGDILNFMATITPESGDYTPNDNTYTLAQTVVNSFDPNDKQVLQGAEILEAETDEYLDYLIRFQNTGTASAINISVTDVLNDKLDWNTLQMVSTSHAYEVNITNGNFVQFVFDGINLPAEQDNEPASHGFIAFKIKPKSDVVIGDIITGQANIYFDYNAPIITNEVSTEIVDESTLSVNKNQIETSIKLYPNPVKNQFNIELLNDMAINSVEVFDISGKQLLEFKASEDYNINKLTPGVYFVKVTTSRGEVHKKLIKN